MPAGPGKYDDECTRVRESTAAFGTVLIVIGGHLGSGFSVQADAHTISVLPDMLEDIAREIRASGEIKR